MVIHNNKLKRIKERSQPKESITVTVNKHKLGLAKELCKKEKFSVSAMFDLFLEDFVYEQLSEEERNEIDLVDTADIEESLDKYQEESKEVDSKSES